MNRCAHNTARHHGFWFAEPQVSDFGSILFVKLERNSHTDSCESQFSVLLLLFIIMVSIGV